MRKTLLAAVVVLWFQMLNAQTTATAKNNPLTAYRSAAEKVNNLVHTKLEAGFDYTNAQLNGKVWLTLQPHFYPTDSLRLDAKGMLIKQVALYNNGKLDKLSFDYSDSMNLRIKLNKTYKASEKYTVFIEYVARPNELKVKGSAAITDAKGLYFINPKGTEKNKPTQIWTQGETEASSVWIPTIDRPNQKTTQEFSLTVPSKYVTLSNGLLVSQKNNGNGTRTDNWKMDLPHAPYLFFIGVGEYSVVKDNYKGAEVSYYVEKPYESVARRIFGLTPEMMQFFSKKLGVEYQWPKYAQIVGRDYVSGAMENTTATLHGESAQQDARELTDENKWEDVIAHELFHHWFGDLVTAESWSNLTVNESFADYSEYLWREYKYGKDAADHHALEALQSYLNTPGASAKDLVRFYYQDKEDMFDVVSYQKGGRILHMLRSLVGDEAFFKSLNLYLTRHKFGTGSAVKLKLIFEEVTGKDLSWFFNQWYYGSGHPSLDISYGYDENAKQALIYIKQTQKNDKVFQLPLLIDVYQGAKKNTYQHWLNKIADTIRLAAAMNPNLINVDANRVLVANKKDSKSLEAYIHQYKYAGSYFDRREAILFAAKNKKNEKALQLLVDALNDPYYELRRLVLGSLDSVTDVNIISRIEQMAKTDKSRLVKADAIEFLAGLNNPSYKQLFINNLNDSSYSVAGAALMGLFALDQQQGIQQAKTLSAQPNKGKLQMAITNILIASGDESVGEMVVSNFENMAMSQEKFTMLETLSQFLSSTENTALFKRGVDAIVKMANAVPASYKDQTDFYIYNILFTNIISRKEAEVKANQGNVSELQQQVDYIKQKKTDKK